MQYYIVIYQCQQLFWLKDLVDSLSVVAMTVPAAALDLTERDDDPCDGPTLMENTMESKQGLCDEQTSASSGVETVGQEGHDLHGQAVDLLAEVQALTEQHGLSSTWEEQCTLIQSQAACIAQKPQNVGQKVLSELAKDKHEAMTSQHKRKKPVENALSAAEIADNKLWQGLKDNGFEFSTDGTDKFNGRFRRYLKRSENAEKAMEYHKAAESTKKEFRKKWAQEAFALHTKK